MNTIIRTSLILTPVLTVALIGRMHKERFHSNYTARVAIVPEDTSLSAPPEPPPTTPSICTNCLQILSRLTPEQLENLNSTYNGVYYIIPTPSH